MGYIHDAKPIIAHGFERSDSFANSVHEDLPAAARNGTEARFNKLADDLLQRQAEHFPELHKLAGAEPENLDLRKPAFDVREQVEILLQGRFGKERDLTDDLRD